MEKENVHQKAERIPLAEILTDLSKQNWKIGPLISTGGYGLYCARKATRRVQKHEDYPYVVKESHDENEPLLVEIKFYMENGKKTQIEAFQKKQGLSMLGIPHFVAHGSHKFNSIKYQFIVMPRFGIDIWDLFMANDRKMPLHTVYRLAIQMLDVYEYIHECTYIHGDLKGRNILLGFGKNGGSQAYLVGFGMASHYTTKDFKPEPKMINYGTIEYTSRDAHQGVPTMRGDFEILAYNLLQWAGGKLPWEENKLLDSRVKVHRAKDSLMANVDAKLKGCFASKQCPEQIQAYFKYVTKLKYDEKPDYERCRKGFANGLKSLGESIRGDLEFKSTKTSSVLRATISAVKNGERFVPNTRSQKRKNERSHEKTEQLSKKIRTEIQAKSSVERVSLSNLSTVANNTIAVSTAAAAAAEINLAKDQKSSIATLKIAKKKEANKHNIVSNTTSQKREIINDSSEKSESKQNQIESQLKSSVSDSAVVINNEANHNQTTKTKIYHLNIDLDISFDANVVVNVKRK